MDNREDWEGFLSCVEDLIHHPQVRRLDQYTQHANSTRYDHSVSVAYKSYIWSKKLGLDARAAARGGLLHDLFFYDWQQKGAAPGPGCHARWHPYHALQNAKKYFTLTKREENIISSHMFPMGYDLPVYRESFVVTWADKCCATEEFMSGVTDLLAAILLHIKLKRYGIKLKVRA